MLQQVDRRAEQRLPVPTEVYLPLHIVKETSELPIKVAPRLSNWLEKNTGNAAPDLKDPHVIEGLLQDNERGCMISFGSSFAEKWTPAYAKENNGELELQAVETVSSCIQGCALSVKRQGNDILAVAQTTCFDPQGRIILLKGSTNSAQLRLQETKPILDSSEFSEVIGADPSSIFLYDPNLAYINGQPIMLVTAGKKDKRAGTYMDNEGRERYRVPGQTYALLSQTDSFEGPYVLNPNPVIRSTDIPFFNQLDDEGNFMWGHEGTVAVDFGAFIGVYLAGHMKATDGNMGWGERQRGVWVAFRDLDHLLRGNPALLGMLYKPDQGEYGAGSPRILDGQIEVVHQYRPGDHQLWGLKKTALDRKSFEQYALSKLGIIERNVTLH